MSSGITLPDASRSFPKITSPSLALQAYLISCHFAIFTGYVRINCFAPQAAVEIRLDRKAGRGKNRLAAAISIVFEHQRGEPVLARAAAPCMSRSVCLF